MKTRKKIASAARNLKVAADAKTAKAVSVDAGLKAAANAAMTTNAKSADEVAVAEKTATTKNADAGLKAAANAATTTNAKSADEVVDAVVVVDAEKTATTKNADAGLRAAANAATTTNAKNADVSVDAGAPKATVVELVTTKSADEVVIAKKAVAARASTAKRS